MTSKPTLILVPGAWHTPLVYTKIISLLDEAQHFKCTSITLPSTMGDPSTTLLDDITAVRDAITDETNEGRDVVLVCHSYGGAVGCSAVKGLTKGIDDDDDNNDAGEVQQKDQGHVAGIILLSSGMGPSGMSFIDGFGGKPPPTWGPDPTNSFAVLAADIDHRELFYHDLPVEEGQYWVERLTKQSLKVLVEGGEWGYAGWKDVPVWLLITTEDKAFPVEAQRYFAQVAKDAGGDITIREIASSHSSMLSKPKETAVIISEAVSAFMG